MRETSWFTTNLQLQRCNAPGYSCKNLRATHSVETAPAPLNGSRSYVWRAVRHMPGFRHHEPTRLAIAVKITESLCKKSCGWSLRCAGAKWGRPIWATTNDRTRSWRAILTRSEIVVVTYLSRRCEPKIAECAHGRGRRTREWINAQCSLGGHGRLKRPWHLRTARRDRTRPTIALDRQEARSFCLKRERSCLDSGQIRFSLRCFRFQLIGEETGDRNRGQNPNDCHDDHQLNQREPTFCNSPSTHGEPPVEKAGID